MNLSKFPSPLGDEVLKPLQRLHFVSILHIRFRPLSGMRCLNLFDNADGSKKVKMFPSPLGDEVLKPWYTAIYQAKQTLRKFPSPLGDEVLKPRVILIIYTSEMISFRPLSGMRCLNRGRLMEQ